MNGCEKGFAALTIHSGLVVQHNGKATFEFKGNNNDNDKNPRKLEGNNEIIYKAHIFFPNMFQTCFTTF